jgi:hypothetical protein
MSPNIMSSIRRNWRSFIGLAIVLAVGPTCGSGGGGGGGFFGGGPTTFNVVTQFPAQAATNVARTQTIYLTVNGAVNPATLPGNVTLIGTNPIPVNLTWNPVLSQIEVTPQSPFMEQNVVHTVNVLAGVQTVGGTSMTPKTITFTTINSADTTVPTFNAALVTTTVIDVDTIRLNWTAGSDGGGTPVGSLIYDVYLATTTGQVNFATAPLIFSAAGATTVDVEPLASNTNYFFVVRCRDAGGNRDANTTESSGKTRVRFSTDIYNAIINNPATGHCTNCHVPAGMAAFMDMSISASDVVTNKWVNIAAEPGTGPSPAPSCGGVGEIRVIPNDAANSLVWKKVQGPPQLTCGVRMPEDGATAGFLTTIQINTIADWINQGAPNN